jgi:hypothetical protein
MIPPTFAPASPCATSPTGLTLNIPISSLRKALNDDGIAPKMTDTASTMATSSSSDRNSSLAASRSCEAMLKLTENARSEPSVFKAPVALISAPLVYHLASMQEVKLFSEECDAVQHGLDFKQGLSLSVRMLLLNLECESSTPGRGGKSTRSRSVRDQNIAYGGVVFGCMLAHVVHFAREHCCVRTSEAMSHLRKCLTFPGQNLMSCTGSDTAHMLRGFASCTATRRQASLFSRSQQSQRIDTRYGHKRTVLSIPVAVFFIFSLAFQRATNVSSLGVSMQYFVDRCENMLKSWRLPYGPEMHRNALDAERRTLERGLLALRAARAMADKKQLCIYDAVQVQLSYLSMGMWPDGKTIDKSTQKELCDWILSDDFANSSTPKLQPRPPTICVTRPIPLSELHTMFQARLENDIENASTTDASSVTTSSHFSVSSVSSAQSHNSSDQLIALTSVYSSVNI